ncbi:hypothetical protein QWY28_03445 [Nocardioides sp. SOB77]|uniref:WXG100 family type VII secretion target n=1 Tax=Nocardioides oceani TaxID=3058369 RepID=A0ABT8FBN4_9ACTN|nr:hypothetical protein [Nocardioides oceani]MDN4171989.1 hypothetical protein [Nocardioides oceani]
MDGAGGSRYGDAAAIRALAARLREQAAEVAAEADRLARLAEATGWTGLAADAMRDRAHDGARALRRTAGLHEDAAEALDRHAAEVQRRTELVAAAERTFEALVDAARDRLGGLVDRFLDQVAPPPSGHRDWLTFELPGFLR